MKTAYPYTYIYYKYVRLILIYIIFFEEDL